MKLSIITINYNNAKGLEQTLRSITPYHHAGFEHLVIDGGSHDGSVDIIEKYCDDIDYWISEADKGIYNAMNKGIKQAKGEYVMFVNSGDLINQSLDFHHILDSLTGEDIIYYDLNIVNDYSDEGYTKIYPDKLDFKFFLEDSLPHASAFIKREKLVDYGYYSEDLKIVSDWAFYIDAICKMNCSYKHINSALSSFLADGISSLPESRAKLWSERDAHIQKSFPLSYTLYQDWMEKKDELYKLKTSQSVKVLKKIGLLKWLKL